MYTVNIYSPAFSKSGVGKVRPEGRVRLAKPFGLALPLGGINTNIFKKNIL